MTTMDADLFACRLCSSSNDLVDVGSEKTPFAAEYRNIVKIMTGIRIYPNDTLLSSICRACLKRAIENYDYRRSAIQRNFELQRKRERLEAELRRDNSTPPPAPTGSVTDTNDVDDDEEVELVAISMDITARDDDDDSPSLQNEVTSTPAPKTPIDKQNDKTKAVIKKGKKRKQYKSKEFVQNSDDFEGSTLPIEKKKKSSPQKNPETATTPQHGKRAAAIDATCRISICNEDEIFGTESSSNSGNDQPPMTETVIQSREESETEVHEKTTDKTKTETCTMLTQPSDNPKLHSSIRKLQAKYPNIELPESIRNSSLPHVTVKLTNDVVKRYIVNLSRRLRRRAKFRKRPLPHDNVDDINRRMDVPDIMPTTPKELKELVTSSLGLLRIAPSPIKSMTSGQTVVASLPALAPESSFQFPQTTPTKSILHPAQQSPIKFTTATSSTPVKEISEKEKPLITLGEVMHRTPTKNLAVADWSHNSKLASPIDTEYTQLIEEPIGQEENEADMLNMSQESNYQPDYSLIQVADEEVVFICDQCHKVFENKGGFIRHRRVHLRCVFCSKVFSTQKLLKKHVRMTCRKVTRRVNVRILRMETDKTIRHLLPKSFFDTTKFGGKPRINEDISDEESCITMVVTAEVHEQGIADEAKDTIAEIDQTPIVGEQDCEEFSDVESMHLFEPFEIKVEEEIAPCEDAPVPTLLETLGCVDEMRLDEANFLQRLLLEPKHEIKSNAQGQVTHKDFVGVESTDQTLFLRNLGHVLKANQIVPVNLKYRPKKLKVRIADYVPPVEEEKFYDFSKMKPVSLHSYRHMIAKRAIYNFAMLPQEVPPAPAIPPTNPVPPMPRKSGKKPDKVKKRAASTVPGLAKVVDNVQLSPYTPEPPKEQKEMAKTVPVEQPAKQLNLVDEVAAPLVDAAIASTSSDTPPRSILKMSTIKILTPQDINNKTLGIKGNELPTPHTLDHAYSRNPPHMHNLPMQVKTRIVSRPSPCVTKAKRSVHEWRKDNARDARLKKQEFIRLLPTSITELAQVRITNDGMVAKCMPPAIHAGLPAAPTLIQNGSSQVPAVDMNIT